MENRPDSKFWLRMMPISSLTVGRPAKVFNGVNETAKNKFMSSALKKNDA